MIGLQFLHRFLIKKNKNFCHVTVFSYFLGEGGQFEFSFVEPDITIEVSFFYSVRD